MDKVKIASDGTAAGTRLTVGGQDITKYVQSISIDCIEPRSAVTATVSFMSVELDIKADASGSIMPVIVDGEEAFRPIASRDLIMLADGAETRVDRPAVYEGEQAVCYLDGSPPVIIKTLKD